MARKTHEQFIEEAKRVNEDIEIIGRYVNARDKILAKCKIHDYEFYITPDNLLRGKGCRLCGNEKIAQSKKLNFGIIQDAFAEAELELLSTVDEIIDLKTDRLRYLCPIHGEQTILWNNFQRGARCRRCADEANSLRMRSETWGRILKYFKYSEYTLVSTFEEYTGTKDSCLRCLCEKHGEFLISWNNLNKFEGCPLCNGSTGERRVFNTLKQLDLKFEHQKRFDGLIGTGGKRLSYDFYVEDYNLLIEYQGEQHNHPVVFSNTTLDEANKSFEIQCEHDKRKREYARDNGFGLLEIWYYDFDNVESILSNYIINNAKLF